MQLLEVERIDALLDEHRDLQRAFLTNLAVNGRDTNTLDRAQRDLFGKLRRRPRDDTSVAAPAARELSPEELEAWVARMNAMQWHTAMPGEVS